MKYYLQCLPKLKFLGTKLGMASRTYAISSISPNLTLYRNTQQASSVAASALSTGPSSGNAGRLIILMPWLYAPKRAIEKYCDVYQGHGLDVLVVQANLQHFLRPSVGRAEALKLLELLTSEGFCHRSHIVVHSISIGNYFYALMLREIRAKSDRFSTVGEKIKGQIVDSLVVGDQERFVNAILTSGQYGSVMRTMVRSAVYAYFALTRKWTTDFHKECIEGFRSNLLRGPLLLLHSWDDPVGDVETTKALITKWRKNSQIDLRMLVWEKSVHAAHLVTHPEEYCQQISRFLQEIQMVPTNAKL